MAKKRKKQKFYRTKEFIKTQNKWYKILKESGFHDLEWYDFSTGMGSGSSYFQKKKEPSKTMIKKYLQSTCQLHRLLRNFLENAPFYPNLEEKYLKNSIISNTYPCLTDYIKQFDQTFTTQEYLTLKFFCDGLTIRETSKELRRLHSLDKLPKPPKRWGKAAKGMPYSTYWVKHKLDYLRSASLAWNLQDEEGLLYEDSTLEDFTPSDIYNGTDDFTDYIGGTDFATAKTMPTLKLVDSPSGIDVADAKAVPRPVDLKKGESR